MAFEADSEFRNLLSTKLALPRVRASMIARSTLFSRLDIGLERKLTLVSAPAGFGKTTLISTWLASRRRASNTLPAAWVSLDEGDNDPVRFWRYVLAASRKLGINEERIALKQRDTTQPIRFEPFLISFINALSDLSDPCVLVLDDYHLIQSSQVHETVAFLLEHLPDTLHVMMLSRSEPPLSFAPLRARDDMLDLHTTDLSFSLEETRKFLEQALPFSLSSKTISHLHARTEGWIVGIQLVALVLQNQTNEQRRHHFLLSFTGSHKPIWQYLVSDVLAVQPEWVQDFLLQTSVLSHLTGPLCDAVTGRADSHRVLEQLENAGIFLVRLGEADDWYRYHTLFAEAMQHEALRRDGLEALRLRYQQAADWYEANDMLLEAIEASLSAAEHSRAASLIARWNEKQAFGQNDELYTLRHWLEQLPPEILRQYPELCFAYAQVLLFTREHGTLPDPSQIEALLNVSEQAWRDVSNQTRLDELLVFRNVFALLRGDSAHAVKGARLAFERLPQNDILWRSISLNIVGTTQLQAGQLAAARQTFEESLSLCTAADSRRATRATSLLLSDVYMGQGELYQAAELYRQVLTDAERDEDLLDRAKALIGLASLSYEWNDLMEAEQQAQQALALGAQLADESLRTHASFILACVQQVQGQTALAQQVLARLIAQISAHGSPPMLWREVRTAQAELALSIGNLLEVQQWLAWRNQDKLQPFPPQKEREDLLVSRLLIVQGEGKEALRMLDPLQSRAREAGRMRSELEIKMVMIQAHLVQDNIETAENLLDEVLIRAQSAGYRRLFLDKGMTIASLLQSLSTTKREQAAMATYIRHLLSAFESQSADRIVSDTEIPIYLNEPLTPQEERSLYLFAEGLSKKEIATEMLISINTVKTHLQRAYQKLNVSSRTEAREISRRLKLLG